MRRLLLFLLPVAPFVSSVTSVNISMSSQSGADSLLPADRNASANWRMAGMASLGHPEPDHGLRHGRPYWGTIKTIRTISRTPSINAPLIRYSRSPRDLYDCGRQLRDDQQRDNRARRWTRVTTLQRANGAAPGSSQPGGNPSPIIVVGPMRWK